jgi:AcrR family transcriptional regulator
MSLKGEAPAQRRRGQVLEEALLEAAWDELIDHGYDALTMDAVAARAGTSRAVLYRRWPGKQELVLAALIREVGKDVVESPDTGSLRGDVIALLSSANKLRVRLATQVFTQLGGFFRHAGTSLADLSEYVLGGRDTLMEQTIQRAIERGEIPHRPVSERIARLPLDLFRYELLVTLQPLSDTAIEEIVDTIFLPLVDAGGPVRDTPT